MTIETPNATANILVHDTTLAMTADFVAEALDLAAVHAGWTGKWLAERNYDRALISFGAFLTAARAAAGDMKPITAKVEMAVRLADTAAGWTGKHDRRGVAL